MSSLQQQDYMLPTNVRNTLLSLLIAVEFAGVVLCALLLVGLLVPLLIQLNKGNYKRTTSLRGRGKEPPYSTYNLYLVYLAMLDIGYLLPKMVANFASVNSKYPPRFHSNLLLPTSPTSANTDGDFPAVGVLVGYPYMVANMWINAVVAHQVWILLQKSHRAQRVSQPSLTKVNLQGGGVIFGSVAYGIYNYYFQLGLAGRQDLHRAMTLTLLFIPLLYVIGVTILVRWRGYIPSLNGSTPRDRAVRGLAFYFFRVSTVFLAVWLPCTVIGVILVIQYPEGLDYLRISAQLLYYSADLLMAIQPILTFWMILTKPDVKKYITDLVTLSHLFGECNCCRKDEAKDNADVGNPDTANEPCCRANHRVTILGYSFEDVDANVKDIASYDSAHDDAQVEVDMDNKNIGDSGDDVASMMDNEDENHEEETKLGAQMDIAADVETGTATKYASRRMSKRGGPAAAGVSATGQAYHISLQRGCK